METKCFWEWYDHFYWQELYENSLKKKTDKTTKEVTICIEVCDQWQCYGKEMRSEKIVCREVNHRKAYGTQGSPGPIFHGKNKT